MKVSIIITITIIISNTHTTTTTTTTTGVYTCHVSNLRGGSIKVKRISQPAVVFVEHSEAYILRVIPYYIPRIKNVRKKWTSYSSVKAHFNRGVIEGMCVV